MIDVGVAGDQDDVAGIPAERVHLGARHRQEGRDAEAGGPVFAMENSDVAVCMKHPDGVGPIAREASRESL